MRRLIADLARRKYEWPLSLLLAAVAWVWWSSRQDGVIEARHAFGMSMGVAFFMGPLLIALGPTVPAIWYLPVSRREVWRATWLLATVGATLLTTAAKLLSLIGPAGPGSLGLSQLALSSTYDFAYTGLGCGLTIASSQLRPRRGAPGRVAMTAQTILGVAVMGGVYWGYALRNVLPTRWNDLSPLAGVTLGAALAAALASYFHTARPAVVPSWLWRSPGTHATASGVGRASSLTALPRLLAHEYAWSVMFGGFLFLTFSTLLFVADRAVRLPNAEVGLLRMMRLLPFDGAAPRSGPGDFLGLLPWWAFFAASLAARFPSTLRHLRVLPIHRWQLCFVLVAWPAAIWLTVWAALLVLHYAVASQPIASLQPLVFLGLTGASAIMQALTLRWTTLTRWILGTSIGSGPMLHFLYGAPDWVTAGLGIGALAAAAALNRVSLTRSETYQRPIVGVAPARLSS